MTINTASLTIRSVHGTSTHTHTHTHSHSHSHTPLLPAFTHYLLQKTWLGLTTSIFLIFSMLSKVAESWSICFSRAMFAYSSGDWLSSANNSFSWALTPNADKRFSISFLVFPVAEVIIHNAMKYRRVQSSSASPLNNANTNMHI